MNTHRLVLHNCEVGGRRGVDVSIERKGESRADDGRRGPNTCPSCDSHYRDDELRAALRVCPQCGRPLTRERKLRLSREVSV